MSRPTLSSLLTSFVVLAGVVAAQGGPRQAAKITFTEHVAKIIFNQCTTCHRPAAIGPFSLTNYKETRRKGKMIKRVTSQRFMPPWHPVPGHGEFQDSRRMSEADVETIAVWVDSGMAEGDPKKLPAMPKFVDGGFQLGEPDLVLTMKDAFEVPAGGPDIYRNFVLPLALDEDKWVSAVEVIPGAGAVLHHTLIFLDDTGDSRRMDGRDGKPGFRGMSRGRSGSLGTWAVGGTARHLPKGLARKLPRGSDIILSSHLHPSGKKELEKTRIGLFFRKQAPSRSLLRFQIPAMFGALSNLRIPAGVKNHRLEDKVTLPCDIELLSVGGHAHYLCKSMQTTALFPDGTKKSIFYIDNWAFNWQGRYQYKTPLILPKGTVLRTVLIYDNSSSNPQNPSDPPVSVRWGLQSTDEMGSVGFLGVPVNESEGRNFNSRIMEGQMSSLIGRFTGGGNRNRGRAPLSFELPKYDKNQDGVIELTEITSRWRRRMASSFDTNGDGEISKKELADAQVKYANRDEGERRR